LAFGEADRNGIIRSAEHRDLARTIGWRISWTDPGAADGSPHSGTYVNQQWPYNPQTPHGAWEFHEHLIPASPRKSIRIWMEVGDFH
jgi:hypothetical protein